MPKPGSCKNCGGKLPQKPVQSSPRVVKFDPKRHEEHAIDEDSLFSLESTSEIISSNSPHAISPQLHMTDSFIRRNGWQNSDGEMPWLKSPPKDECALLKDRIVARDCNRSSYGRYVRSDKDSKGTFLAMDDVELLERGLLNKQGSRQQNHADYTDQVEFVPTEGGGRRVIDASARLPESPKHDRKSKQLVNPFCGRSLTTIHPDDCFTSEQLHHHQRLPSPSKKKEKTVRKSRTLGTIECEVGSNQDKASFQYTISEDGRTYAVVNKPDGESDDCKMMTLEFGALRSILKVVGGSDSNNSFGKQMQENVASKKKK